MFGPAALSNATSLIYTVPAGVYVVLRSISLVNNSSSITSTIRLGIGGTANSQRIMRQTMVPEASLYVDTRLALSPGELLYGYADASGSATCTITAYVFEP